MSLLDDLKKRQQTSQPTAALAGPEATHDIEKNLAVNPPPVAGTAVEPVTAKQETPPADGKTPCPTCGVGFKHLSRHRCKEAEAPAIPPASAITFPTDAMLDVILPTLHGPALDAYVSQYGVTRANAGDDPQFRETIKRLITRQRDGVIEEPFIEPEVLQAEDPQPAIEANIDIHIAPGVDEKEVGKKVAEEVKKATARSAKAAGLENKADTWGEPFTGDWKDVRYGKQVKTDEAPCFDLIIGCEIIQSDMNIVYFHDIVFQLEKKILEAAGVHWAEIEYGKGKAALCECLDMMIQAGDLNNSTVVVTTRTPVYLIVADLLRQYARNVIVSVE